MAKQTHYGKSPLDTIAASKGQAVKQRQKSKTSTAADRHRMIAESAFFIAEHRNFQGDLALADWLQAEADIDTRLSGSCKDRH